MKSKLAVLLVALFVLIPMARSAPLSARITGAVMQSSEFDATKNVVTVHILNTSHKDISGLVVSSQNGIDMYDFLPTLLRDEHDFAPGAVITQQISTPSPKVEITVVTYGDSTTEVTDQLAFDMFMQSRTAHVLALQKLNGIIQQSLADKSVTDHRAAILAQVEQARVAMAKPSDALGLDEAAALKQETLDLPTTDEELTALCQENEKRIVAMTPHTKPEVQK